MAFISSDQFSSSLAPVSANNIISICHEKLRFIETKKQEEIDYLILKNMEPKKFLFWTRKRNRDEAIELINQRKIIGAVELNSPKEDIEYKWLNESVKVENILRLANLAKDNQEEKIFINTKDAELLGYSAY